MHLVAGLELPGSPVAWPPGEIEPAPIFAGAAAERASPPAPPARAAAKGNLGRVAPVLPPHRRERCWSAACTSMPPPCPMCRPPASTPRAVVVRTRREAASLHPRAIGARPSRSGAASRRPFDSARPHISLPRGRGHPRNIWRPFHRGAALARKHPSLTVASRNILRRDGRAHGTGYAWPCRIRTAVAPVRAPRSPRPLADRYLYGEAQPDRGCPPREGRSRRGPERGD